MLKGIKDVLKTMGEALAFADAGEMLPGGQKARVLARQKGPCPIASDAVLPRVVLAGDEEFPSSAVEHAIALCREKNAMLDLLCVSPKGNGTIKHLATAWPRLESEIELDFQVVHRHGELLAVTDAYLRARRDTLMILISVSDRLRNRAERYRRTGKWFRTTQLPVVELIDEVVHV